MKKLICAALVSALLLCACGAAIADETAFDRLTSDWLNLLYSQDDCYSQEDFALAAIAKFYETREWDDLVRARAATEFTCRLAEHCADYKIEITLTDDDFEYFEAQGIDLRDVRADFRAFNADIDKTLSADHALFWREYFAKNLLLMVYLTPIAEELNECARLYMDYHQTEYQMLYLKTNYIYLELPDSAAQKLWTAAEQYAPSVMAAYPRKFDTANDVLNEMNAVVKRTEDLTVKIEELLMKMRVTLETLDFSDCITINNLPIVAPGPIFGEGDFEALYYWTDEQGELTALSRRQEMPVIPNTYQITAPSASNTEYMEFVLYLYYEGFPITGMGEFDAEFEFEGGERMLVWWSEEEGLKIFVSGQICLAPAWYYEFLKTEAP